MKITNIKLENYRKYANETIDFPDGLVGIVGPNGAGKSTILEAVAWALYGNAAARTTKEQIRRHGASLNDLCQVVLEIEENGGTSQIIREMRGANFSSDAAVYTNKKLMARGTHAATEYVTNLLGLDREAFFTSFFAKQKELNTLSDLRPAERKNLIIKMLEIDDIDTAIQQIRQDVRDIDVRADILKNTLKDLTSLEFTLSTKESEVKKLQKELDKKAKEEDVLQKERDKNKTLFQKEEERKDTYLKLVQEYNLTKSQLSNSQKNFENSKYEHDNLIKMKTVAYKLEPGLKEFGQVKNECQKLDELKGRKLLSMDKILQKQKLEAKLEKEKEDKKALSKKISSVLGEPCIEKRLKQMEAEREKEKENYDKIQMQASKTHAELESLKEQEKNLKIQSKEIKKLGPKSKCPTCFRSLGEDFSKIEAHFNQELSKCTEKILQQTSKLNKLQERIEISKDTIEKLQKAREELKNKQNELQIAQNELALRGKSIKQIEEELKQVSSQLSALSSQLQDYNEERHLKLTKKLEQLSKKRDEFLKIQANLERLPEIEKSIYLIEKEIKKYLEELAEIKETGKKLGFSQDQYDRIRKTFEHAEQKYNDFRLMVKDLQHTFNLFNLEIEKLKKEIEEDKEKQEEIKELTVKRQYLDKTQLILSDFRKHLIGRIRPLLSQKASEFLAQVTDEKYSYMELNEDYEIFIYDEGEKFLIDRFSGGEKDLANLCLRLAISQLITESTGSVSEFIILDEVFGSQDAERKNNILKALSKLSNQFRQIFLITHIDDMKDQMEYVLSIQEDEAGISHARLE